MNRRFLTLGEGVAVAAVVLALALWLLLPKGAGVQAVVTRSGEEIGRYGLSAPARVPVQGANGFSLVLVIEDGRAWVEDATCPDLLCQHHAPISREGESIICLPGQVTVQVEGGERLGADAIAG